MFRPHIGVPNFEAIKQNTKRHQGQHMVKNRIHLFKIKRAPRQNLRRARPWPRWPPWNLSPVHVVIMFTPKEQGTISRNNAILKYNCSYDIINIIMRVLFPIIHTCNICMIWRSWKKNYFHIQFDLNNILHIIYLSSTWNERGIWPWKTSG